MSKVTDLAAARWQRSERADESKPIDALREAIRQIEAGEISPTHVIIAFASLNMEENISSTDWLQAGPFNNFEQTGLLWRVMNAMPTPA